MANTGRVNVQVGFTVDKSGLTQMQSLFQQIANAAKEPGNQLNAGLQQAAVTANTLDGILEKTFNTNLGTLNVTKFNQELNKSGLTLKSVQADLTKAGNQGATAYNRLAQAVLGTNLQLKESNKLLDSMATTMANTVKWGITSSIFNTITNSIQKAYTYSKQLDTSLNDIRIVTDKSAGSMARFAVEANEAAKGLGASTLDYTNASLIYYQQGLSDEEVQARAETTVKAANITGQTGEEVSDQLTAVWNGYKVSAEETEAYVDKLAAVAATTAADLEELSKGMSKVAAAANTMGVDFDDLNAQIATIVSVTRQAPESVGTALKTIYARLGDLKVDGVDEFGVKLGEVSSQMQTMGIQILDQQGNLRDMSSVIAEVAQKWGTWTEAQRQAAAVAMAGKRQYNNLIALFDNWDKYTDALNTSQEALGTLQHQQDIYMESTAAKLKTLKATWQDVYGDLINEDELNAGIEGLTNLVQVFDNFIESFGGGIKSITAFGAIVANIFNKQIANAITEATIRQQQYQQNIVLLQAKQEAIQKGTIQTTGSSMRDAAIEVNTQKQLDIAREIYEVRAGLTTEEYNNLTAMQQQVGALAEEQEYTRLSIIDTEKKVLDEKEITDLLTKEYSEVEKIRDAKLNDYNKANDSLSIEQQKLDVLENQVDKAIKYNATAQSLGGYKSAILQKANAIGEAEGIAVQKILNNVKNTSDLKRLKSEIIEACQKQVNKESENVSKIEEELEAQDRVLQGREKIAESKEKELNLTNQINAGVEKGAQGKDITQTVVGVTSALGSMAMAWSSVNSLMKTWNDESVSFGDKLTQTFMTLSMSLPMLLSSFGKLRETLGATSTVWQVLQKSVVAHTTSISANRAAMIAENVALASSTELEELKNFALEKGLIKEGENISATKLKEIAEYKAAVATTAHKEAQDALNSSMLANPIVLTVAVLATLTAGIAFATKQYEEFIQAQIDANNKTIENADAIQSEVDANKELYDSYDKLYNQYKNNEIEKEALYDTTDKLCEKYNLEEGYLAKLTGNYDKLTQAIKKTRLEELKQAQEASKKEVDASKSNILPLGQQTSQGALFGNYYQVAFDSGFTKEDVDRQAEEIFQKYIPNSYIERQGAFTNVVSANAEDIINQYNQISKAVEEAQKIMSEADKANSEVFQNAKKYVEDMAPAIEQYKTALNQLDDYDVQLILTENDLEGIKSFEEYNNKINEIRNNLKDQFNGDSEKVNSLLETYLQGIDNEFVKIGHGLELLKKELNLSEEDFEKLLNWSDEDKKLLLSGEIEFDGFKTEEELRKALNIAKNNLSEEDLSIAVSLRSKVSSDKKLTKTQIKEAAGEQSTLAQDYEVELSDFDDESQLKQLDTLNKIIDDKIELNRKYIDDAKGTAAQEAEVLEIRKTNWEKEKALLEGKKAAAEKGGAIFSEEDAARLQELEDMLVKVEGEVTDLQDIAVNGLGFDELNELNYDNLISGIDGIITEAEVLKNLTDDIGENWTIAGDKIENFGKNFPEILESAENYKFLQDGSLQLTEAGREALEGTLAARKENLNAINQEYQLELQKQADIQQATADYYNQQADLLQAYLDGEADAKETETNMEKALADYKNNLMQVIGDNNEELNRIMQENGAQTRISAEADEKAIYEYWCSVGEAAEAASLAYENKSFNPPGFKGGGGSGGAKTANFKGKEAGETSSTIERLSSDQIKGLIDTYRKKAEDASNKAADYISKKLGAASVIKGFENSADNAISGKGNGKSSKGGGGKDKKDKDEKKYRDEFDRYWELNKAIETTDKAMKKLEKDQKNLFGYQLIDSLKKTNKLLDQQAANYEKLAEAQQTEAAELRNQLGTMGVMFDASGAITNYAAATAQALAAYNDAIQKYNAGLIDETAFGVYEKSFENFKKLIERYDNLYYKEIQETKEKLDDIRREKLANNLKAWEVEVDLKLNLKELKRGWNDFLKEIREDFKKVYKDLTIETKNLQQDAKTYLGKDGSIGTTIKAIQDVTKEIDKMRGGGFSEMFESISQAQEKLRDLNDKLQDNAKGLHDLWKEAWDAYIDGIDQVSDKFDDLLDRFDKMNDELEFQGQLIELLYGEKAYDLMSKLYQGQEKSVGNQLESVKKQAEMWEKLWRDSGATMDNQTSWTEDQKKYYDQWLEAQEKLNDLVINYIKLLKDDYLNTIEKVLAELEKSLTGSSLQDVKTQWERISAYSDKYLDDVEQAYETQKLANKINESIANTSNLKNQQKLQAFRDKEIKYLREKENLTQYDLDAAEARYQIALKEMALEDARNNKTSMKLVRNEQGNWSYQYLADEEEVASKQQELLDAYNNLYQLASDAYESNLQALQDLQEKYLESAKEIYTDETLTEEEKQQKLLDLRTWYLDQYKLLAEENTLYRNDLATSSAALLLEIYEQDKEAYTAMTEEERELVDALIEANIEDYMDLEEKIKDNYKNIDDMSRLVMADTRADWTSTAQLLADLWNKDAGGSVRYEVISAYNQMVKATENYKNKLDWLAAAAERNFGSNGITGAIEKAADATDDLKYRTEDLVTDGINYLADLRRAVEEIEDAWKSVQDAIEDAIRTLEEYINMVAKANAAEASSGASIGGGGAGFAAGRGSGNGSGSGEGFGPGNSNDNSKKVVSVDYRLVTDPYGVAGTWGVVRGSTGTGGPYVEISKNKAYLQKKYGTSTKGFDTGGYTGEWNGDSGRLAMLHQKEIVLNKDDTANFLSGISMIRDMSGINGSISKAVMQAVVNMTLAIGRTKAGNINGTVVNETNQTEGNTFNITANFPNANDVNDIREAIMSLPNLATQFVARNGK